MLSVALRGCYDFELEGGGALLTTVLCYRGVFCDRYVKCGESLEWDF